MKTYLIIGDTLRDSMYCFSYMTRLLHDKIIWASKIRREIHIDEYILKFTSDELYWRQDRFGNRAEVLNCYYVERLLDTYSVLKGETK